MCGLVGVAGDLFHKDIQAFNNMLVMNAVRGSASTGVVAHDLSGDGLYHKDIGDPHRLMDFKSYDKVVNASRYYILGHGRLPTQGSVHRKNAHPFCIKHISLAHNGSISYSSKQKLKDAYSFDTDSEAICNSIAEIGTQRTIEQLEGAWALCWYDQVLGTINFIRNKERPLFYAFSKDRQCLYWASEAYILKACLYRNGIEFDSVREFAEDMWYQLQRKKSLKDPFGPFEKTRLQGFRRPQVETTHFGGGGTHKPWTTPTTPEGTQEASKTGEKSSRGHLALANPEKTNTSGTEGYPGWGDHRQPNFFRRGNSNVTPIWDKPQWRPPYKDSHGLTVTPERFEELVKCGCGWCSETPKWGDRVAFLGEDDTGKTMFLCEDCIMDEQKREVIGL